MDPMTFVSLYSGCGGLDLGFARAGFRPIWANDFSQDAVDTYNRISKVEDVEWADAAKRFVGHQAQQGDINDLKQQLVPGMAELVIGGPPCQGFSVAGRMDPADPRSRHVFTFLEVVERIQPRAFVMENVKALGKNSRWLQVRTELEQELNADYDVQIVVLDASHWGVPQRRERMFMLGVQKGLPPLTMPPSGPTADSPPSARSALQMLPSLGIPGNETQCTAAITLAKKPVLRVSPFAGMLFNGQGRPIDLDRPAPTLAATMGGNRTPIIDIGQLHSEAEPWVVGYHRRLVHDAKPPLKRLPASARMRRLSVEEAAALQTFPKGLDWQGPRSARYRQVGNAVPPVLAWRVAELLRSVLHPE